MTRPARIAAALRLDAWRSIAAEWSTPYTWAARLRRPSRTRSLLSIGELARRTGVTTSALRYYEEFGLLPAPARVSGQRRYQESATRGVGMILLYSDAGFSLAEQKALMASRSGESGESGEPGEWQRIAREKLAELDEQIARAQAARDAISHGLRCRHR